MLAEPEESGNAREVEGPPTVVWVARYMAERGGPMAFHSRWEHEAGLSKDELIVLEHESLCRIFHAAVVIDQVHASRTAFGELLARGIQRIQDRHRDRFLGKPTLDNQGGKKNKGRSSANPEADLHVFMGAGSFRGRICFAPQPRELVADQKHREVAILKGIAHLPKSVSF